MQRRFLPLVFALLACSNESAPAPDAAGALGGIQKTWPTAETPPPSEPPPASETATKRATKATSNIAKKYEQTADGIAANFK